MLQHLCQFIAIPSNLKLVKIWFMYTLYFSSSWENDGGKKTSPNAIEINWELTETAFARGRKIFGLCWCLCRGSPAVDVDRQWKCLHKNWNASQIIILWYKVRWIKKTLQYRKKNGRTNRRFEFQPLTFFIHSQANCYTSISSFCSILSLSRELVSANALVWPFVFLFGLYSVHRFFFSHPSTVPMHDA